MKKLNVTPLHEPSTVEDQTAFRKLLVGVNACYMAFMFDIELAEVPVGLEPILTGESRERFTAEVNGCNRMVAFISFYKMGPWAEITVSEGRVAVKKLIISFDIDSQQFLVIAK